MKAVILAAGIGSRLRPITDNKPKTMVEVNGKPMLGYIIDALIAANIRKIGICTGYKSEIIEEYCRLTYPSVSIVFFFNKDYNSTNNMYSLFLAREYLDDDFLLMNADLVFSSQIIKGLVAESGSCVAVDKGRYLEESMKIIVDSDNFVSGISKTYKSNEMYGSSIDVYRIAKTEIGMLKKEMNNIIVEREEKNQWTEVLLDNLFKRKSLRAKPYPIKGEPWYEIDNFEDLAQAEILFAKNIEKLKEVKAYFIDKDGTLMLGAQIIPGAVEFVDTLKEQRKSVFLLTNNSSKTPEEHATAISKNGINIRLDEIISSLDSTLNYLMNEGLSNIYYLANPSVEDYIISKGFTKDASLPSALLLTYDNTLNYEKIVSFIELARKKLPYFVTHCDLVCPNESGVIPDIGCIIDIVKSCTGRLPDKTFGKPSAEMISEKIKTLYLESHEVAIVGDRLYTDIVLAKNTNAISVLVLSGDTDRAEYEKSSVKADFIFPSIADLTKLVSL